MNQKLTTTQAVSALMEDEYYQLMELICPNRRLGSLTSPRTVKLQDITPATKERIYKHGGYGTFGDAPVHPLDKKMGEILHEIRGGIVLNYCDYLFDTYLTQTREKNDERF